jgi:two-component system, NtrC family, nitrogen regulation sensor histidine kinase NtrY
MFKSLGFKIILRVSLLFLSLWLLVHLYQTTTLWFSIIGLAGLIILQLILLINLTNKVTADVERFADTLKNKDYSLVFSTTHSGGGIKRLYKSFNDIILHSKNLELERERIFLLFQTILEKVKFGVITIYDEALEDDNERQEILFMNEASLSILGVPKYQYWRRLENHIPELVSEIRQIRNGGKKFLEMLIDGTRYQLSVEVMRLQLINKAHLIITIQNIKDEVEQKEIEAWNKLINVLSHEILNSITPIASLSDTLGTMLDGKTEITDKEDIEDLQTAVRTIKKRSEGIADFVKDYRLVAELPSPIVKTINIEELISEVLDLMKPLIQKQNIKLNLEDINERDTLEIDKKLIDQVLINLVTNAIHAVKDKPDALIKISTQRTAEVYRIIVSDNGKGISKENLDKIFIPFFTTREGGSGIGLTICKNIMQIHNGKLEVSSVIGQGSVFQMVFNFK